MEEEQRARLHRRQQPPKLDLIVPEQQLGLSLADRGRRSGGGSGAGSDDGASASALVTPERFFAEMGLLALFDAFVAPAL